MATQRDFKVKNGLNVGINATITGSLTASSLVYPTSDGASGHVLKTDGSGTLSFGAGTSEAFRTIAISGQSSLVADSGSDTLTIVEGNGITLTTNAGTDTLTLAVDESDFSISSNNVTENTNLYFTNARAIAAVQGAAHLTIDSGTLYVDTSNNYVGIGDTSPQYKLDVAGHIKGQSNLYVDGSVGIGINSPTQKLTVQETHANSAVKDTLRLTTTGSYSSSNSEEAGAAISFGQFHNVYPTWQTGLITGIRDGSSWNGSLAFYTNTGSSATSITEKMRILGTGNVGIGTTSPDLKLDVSHGTGSEYVATFQNTADNLELKIGTVSGLLNIQGANATSNAAYQIALNAEGGNVGIGTVSPAGKLNVVSTAHNNGAIFDSTGTAQLWLRDTDAGSNQKNWGFQISGGDFNIIRANDNRASGFVTPIYMQQAPNNSLVINSSGHIGFGASNNSSYDSNAQNLLLASSGNTGMTIRSAGSTPFAMIHFADGVSNNDEKRAGRILYQHDGNNLTLHTANTERLRITGSGDFGIGETSPANILHIKTSAGGGPQIELDSTSGTANSGFIGFDGTSLQLATQRDMVDGSKRDTAKSWGGINIVGAAAGSYIQLQTSEGNNNNASTRMTINSSGLVEVASYLKSKKGTIQTVVNQPTIYTSINPVQVWAEASSSFRVSITPRFASGTKILGTYSIPINPTGASNILMAIQPWYSTNGGTTKTVLNQGGPYGSRITGSHAWFRSSNGYDVNDMQNHVVHFGFTPGATTTMTWGFYFRSEAGNTTYFCSSQGNSSLWGWTAPVYMELREVEIA